MGETSHENRFTCELAFACVKKFAQKAPIRLRAITHACLKGNALFHVIHHPGFGNNRLPRVEFDFNDLNILADDLVIHFVTFHGCRKLA